MLLAPKIDPSCFLNTMHLVPWKLVPLFAEYQSIRLVHLQTFLSIIFIMVFNEISIFDDVHQTVVNSGIETTYRSGALEFTSLFSVVRFTQFFIVWMVRCDKIFSAKTVISRLTLWLSNYSFIGLPQSLSLTAFVWFLVWTFFSLVMHECCWNSSHQC